MEYNNRRMMLKFAGAALIILAFLIPSMISDMAVEESHRQCIQAHGNWTSVLKQCNFKDIK